MNEFDWEVDARGYTIPEIASRMPVGTTRLSVVAKPGDAAAGDIVIKHSLLHPLLLVRVTEKETQRLLATQKLFPNLGHESGFTTGFFEGMPGEADMLILVIRFNTSYYPVFINLMKEEHLTVIGKLIAGEELLVNFISCTEQGSQEVIYAAPLNEQAKTQFLGAFRHVKSKVIAKVKANPQHSGTLWDDAAWQRQVEEFASLPPSDLVMLLNNLQAIAEQQAGEPPDVLFLGTSAGKN